MDTETRGKLTKTLTLRFTEEEYKKFKIYTVMHDTDMTTFLRNYVRKTLAAEERKKGKQNAE